MIFYVFFCVPSAGEVPASGGGRGLRAAAAPQDGRQVAGVEAPPQDRRCHIQSVSRHYHQQRRPQPLLVGNSNICCPRDYVTRHNGGTSGAPLKPLRDDSVLRALSSLRGLRGAPEVPTLCRETSVSRTANIGTVDKNKLRLAIHIGQ